MTTATSLPLPAAPADLADYFESVYTHAEGDASRIPWADGRPCPALVTWLDFVAPSLIRCGARVAVVGCGLGEDARELIRRGYDVTAFDISNAAVRWARELDAEHGGAYHRADLFSLPPRWVHRFDLVVEISTIQSMPPTLHAKAVHAMGQLVGMRGLLLVIGRAGAEPSRIEDGPPWPMTRQQLCDFAALAGFEPDGQVDVFDDDEAPPVRRMRALFHRV
jgi:SAM-dependent methyltransferase